MRLRIPHRDLDEPLTPATIAALTKTLDEEDRLVTRELLRRLALAGARTMRDVVVGFEQLDTGERKALLRKLRAAMKREEPKCVTALHTGGGWSEWQACPACGAIPVNQYTGAPEPVDVERWWCPSHRSMAGPGDLARKTSGLRYSPSGAIVEDNPAELEREQREAAYRARRHEELLKVRAVEAEEMRRRQEALDAMHRRETPPGVGG